MSVVILSVHGCINAINECLFSKKNCFKLSSRSINFFQRGIFSRIKLHRKSKYIWSVFKDFLALSHLFTFLYFPSLSRRSVKWFFPIDPRNVFHEMYLYIYFPKFLFIFESFRSSLVCRNGKYCLKRSVYFLIVFFAFLSLVSFFSPAKKIWNKIISVAFLGSGSWLTFLNDERSLRGVNWMILIDI